MTEEQAKWVLYNAIVGQSSRLVISSMNPELAAIQHMEFREYLRRMGEKFTPAAKSIQMEAEYRSPKQGKNEDVVADTRIDEYSNKSVILYVQ